MIVRKVKDKKINLKTSKIFYPLFLLTLLLISSCGQKEKKEEPTFNIKTESKTTPVVKTNSDKTQNTNVLGKRMFIACAACHNLKKGEPHKVGPNLYGIFGKKSATTEGFEYSEALKNSGITWSEETIRKWMQDPSGYVPQTKMAFVGIKKEKQQTALIEYLKEETKIE